MATEAIIEFRVADRIWVAVALLHQQFCLRNDFTKEEIKRRLKEEGLDKDIERSTLSAHLDQHCVANVPPSSGKYRMLYETTPGGSLRLFRPGDFTSQGRVQKRKPSKSVPRYEELPQQYHQLLDWYETWVREQRSQSPSFSWEDDPLLQLRGSGRHIWADEHADDYVERLRKEQG